MRRKILAVLMVIAVLLCFMPTMAFATGSTGSPSAVQIDGYYTVDKDKGTLKTGEKLIGKEGPTENAYADGQVKVNKTIAGTSEENVFDVTLKVTTKDVEIEQSTSEAAAVVLVIDTSNSMEKDGKFNKIKTAAKSFIAKFASEANKAGEGSKISIVDFSGQHNGSYKQGNETIYFNHIDGAKTGLS